MRIVIVKPANKLTFVMTAKLFLLICVFTVIAATGNIAIASYHRRGKIRWAKHSRFQPYEVLRGNTFAVPGPAVFFYKTIAKYSRENFRGTLIKTAKTAKV